MPYRIVMKVKGIIEEDIEKMVEKSLIVKGKLSNRIADPDDILRQMGLHHLVGKVNLKVVREDKPGYSQRDKDKAKRLESEGRKIDSPIKYENVFREAVFYLKDKKTDLPELESYLEDEGFEYE